MTLPLSGKIPERYAMKLEYCASWLEGILEKFAVKGMQMPAYGNGLCSACGFNLWAGLFKFCKDNSGAEINGGAELCAGNEVIPRGEMRYTVLMGKCAISRNKKIQKTIKVPGCPPNTEKVAAILTKACFSEK